VSAIYTFPQGCKLTIVDSRITGNSVIILQYVGGGIISPTAAEIVNGKFTAVGLPNRRFRYVVQN
jgi:hypothetical protein